MKKFSSVLNCLLITARQEFKYLFIFISFCVSLNMAAECPEVVESATCDALTNGDFEAGNFPSGGAEFAFAGGNAVDFGDETPDSWTQATASGGNYWVESSAALSGNKYIYQFSPGTTTGVSDACSQYDLLSLDPNTCYQICVYAADANADGFSSGLAIELEENGGGYFSYSNFEVPDNPLWDDNALTTIPWVEYCYSFTTQSTTTAATLWISASAEVGTASTSYIAFDDVSLCTNESGLLEIGNYIWCDSQNNGIQDASEEGINDIIVSLYDRNGLLVGQDTSSNVGQYYFNQNNVDSTGITINGSGTASPVTSWSGMSYSTQYFIVFGEGQFASSEFTVGSDTYGITSMNDIGSNDNIDSDVDGNSLTAGGLGARPDGLPFIDMTTSAAGCNDQRYDLGLTCTYCTNPTLTVSPAACQEATNTYSLTGTFTFYNAPPAGTLVIRVANEESQIFTPPFNSPQNFVFSDLNSDGESKEVEVYFTHGGCNETVSYIAPDVCVSDSDVCPSGETLGFEIQKDTILYKTTDFNEGFNIQKFDEMGGTRILQKVLLSVGQSIRSSGVMESGDNQSSGLGLKLVGSGMILLDGSTISTTNLFFDSGEIIVSEGIPVPAQGSWGGDVVESTLFGMNDIISTNLDNLTDPRQDPGWVTNLTGNPIHDDDMVYFPPIFADKTVNQVFINTADLAKFIGVGNVDLVFDAEAASLAFGSGNVKSLLRTKAQAVAFVKYVYCETCPPSKCGKVTIERN